MRELLQKISVAFLAIFWIYALFSFVRRLTETPLPLQEEEGSPEETSEDTSLDEDTDLDLESFNSFDKSHFGFMHPNKLYEFAQELNVHWERNPFAPFIWGEIEKSSGSYDWSTTDDYVKKAQNHDIAMMATIWPYADWDQESCHDKLPYSSNPNRPDLGEYKQMPCDMESYKSFVGALVERYDGDGEDDLEGLKYPIRYWEVMDEPEEGEDVKYLNFKGEDQVGDYLEILKATGQAVKSVDSQSKVLNGGISELAAKEWTFWETIFRGVGRDYVDIITIHAVNSTEHLQMEPLSTFMSQYVLSQPVWITEVQFSTSAAMSSYRQDLEITRDLVGEVSAREVLSVMSQEDRSEEGWAEYMVKVYVKAFANGASRIFYVGLHNMRTGQNTAEMVYCEDTEANLVDNFTELDSSKCTKQKVFYAFATLVSKIDYFEDVGKLAEGQYKVALRKRTIYVLWGDRGLPKEVKGSIRVTDIYGESEEMQAENLFLSDEPVYVEVL